MSWTVAAATDNVGINGAESESTPSGSFFAVGTTIVTRTAQDAAGNSISCQFNVLVVDNENPAITCPSSIRQQTDPGLATAVVSWPTATYNDNVGVTSTSVTHTSGVTAFPLGVTSVSYTVSDAANNQQSCTFTVTVVDLEKPTITCPPSVIQTTSSGQNNRQVSWTPPVSGSGASDNQGI